MTLINHTYGFVFVHVPKNAGTSVAHYLSQLSTYRDQEIGATDLGEAMAPQYRKRFRLHKHSTLAEIRRATGPDALAEFRTLAVVRDPMDRVRSIYSFLRKWPGWTSLDPAYERLGAEFAELDGVDAFIASDLFLMSGPDRLFLPQVSWLTLDDEASIAVDHLVRYEHLERDLQQVVAELGLPSDRLKESLSRSNVSRSGRIEPLRPESIGRVRARYARDFQLLGPWS